MSAASGSTWLTGPGQAVITGVGLAVTGLNDAAELLRSPEERDGAHEAEGAEGANGADVAMSGRGMRHKDRASRLALRAADRTLRDAGLLGDDCTHQAPARTAVVVSSNFGNLDTVCEFTDTIHRETVVGLSPMRIPHMSSNVTACWVALEHGLRGPNLTLCSGTASGLDAVFWACTMTTTGRADLALVIGVEPDTGPVARLHDQDGAGRWVDGAAGLVVESAAHAARRGALPRARISGYGRALDRETAARQARSCEPSPIHQRLTAAHGAVPGEHDTNGPPVIDVTARLGRCSGALGVLQCAAGVARFDQGGTGPLLAVAGSGMGPGGRAADGEGDPSAAAALLLTAPEHHTAERSAA